MTADNREFIYRVDSADQIVFANEHWYDFARENDVLGLQQATVIGRPLWDFIANPEILHLFQVLHARIRRTGTPVTLHYRCDSPDCRRFMELKVVPQAAGAVEFRSRILRTEPRDHVRLLEPEIARTEEWIMMCSWCKKVALPGGYWVEVEEAVNALHLFNSPRMPRISHGICGECGRVFEQSLEQQGS
jgi:hypothetical protein